MGFLTSLIITAVLTLALALLQPKPKIENARASSFGDFQFPRVDEGVPVPFIFGKVKLAAPTVLWYGDFRSEPITKKVKTGLFSSKTQIIGYQYYMTLDLALAVGPDVNLHKIYVTDKNIVYNNTTGLTSDASFNVNNPNVFGGKDRNGGINLHCQYFTGSFSQSRSTGSGGMYHATSGYDLLPAYRGISHIVVTNSYIGNSPNLTQWFFELSRYYNGLGLNGNGQIGEDMNPVEVLYTILTLEWPTLGLLDADLDVNSFIEAGNVVQSEGLAVAGKIEQSSSVPDTIEELLRVIDAVIYEDPLNRKIVLKLIREDYDVNTLPVLDPSNITSFNRYSQATWAETKNEIRVVYKQRSKEYKSTTAIAQDTANIGMFGKKRSVTLQMPFVKLADVANKIAARELKTQSSPLISMSVSVNRSVVKYKPGDVVKVNWPQRGISNLIMRVQKYDLGTLESGEIKMELVQDRFATSETVFSDPPETLWQTIIADPVDISEANIQEAPRFLVKKAADLGIVVDADEARLMYATHRPNEAQISYVPEVSDDGGSNYFEDNDDTLFSVTAVLVNDYTEEGTDEYDTSVGIVIDNISDASVLASASQSDVENGENLFIVNDEIMAYTYYTNLGGGQYRLNNVWRGVLDTVPQDHAAGDRLYFVSGLDQLGENFFNGNASLKTRLIPRTSISVLDESSATVRNITLNNRSVSPYPVDNLTIDNVRFPTAIPSTTVDFAWDRRDRLNATVVRPDDSDTAPTNTTSYKIDYTIDGGSTLTHDFGSVSSGSHTFPSKGFVELDFIAVENGVESYFPIARSFALTDPPTLIEMLDIPLLSAADDLGRANSRLYFAADTVSNLEENKGSGYTSTGDMTNIGTCTGTTVTALPSVDRTFVTDNTNTVTITSTSNASLLQSVTKDELLQGQNRMALNQSGGTVEIIGFQTVTDLGNDEYELSGLLRGLRGTEVNVGNNAVSDTFVLLDNPASTQLTIAELNTDIDYRALVLGQTSPPEVTNFQHTGSDLKPYAVTELNATIDGSNNIDILWKRRSRLEPTTILHHSSLEEDSEEYEIEIYDGTTLVRTETGLTTPSYTYTSADQTTDGFSPPLSTLKVKVFQISGQVDRGFSEEVTLDVQ